MSRFAALSLSLGLVLGLFVSIAPAADPVKGTVAQVTLYRGQALVTRVIPADGKAGSQEIVVSELPEQVLGDSMFAEAGEGVEIRAVRFRTRPVGEEPREEVRKLDTQIADANRKIAINTQAMELANKRATYLDQLESFVAGTAKGDLAKGALDADALQKITLFSFEQRKTVADERNKLAAEAEALHKQVELLQAEKSELTTGSTKLVREAVLFVQKNKEGPETVRLNYLVAGCGWSPSYVFRAGKDQKEVQVEYNALIQQMTGEDWTGVQLTLSTASPALSAAGPGLAPFHVTLMAPAANPKGAAMEKDVQQQLAQIKVNQTIVVNQYRNTLNQTDNLDANWRLNSTANDFQCVELLNPKDMVVSSLMSVADDQGPSLAYKLTSPVSLPSRNDQQMVRILAAPMKSRFYFVATPLLHSFVYREADITNNSPEDLLGGPVTVYLDGRFVGRTEVPTVARGETFVVGFGADAQLRAKRELVDKSESTQGGNREINFRYRLAIENFKEEAVQVRLFDRLPHAERTADVRITMSDAKDSMSDDKVYVRKERPKGILRWDVEVPAGATGEKAKVVEYGYKVEYDRNFAIAAASDGRVQQEQQKEFEELQRVRSKR